MDSEDGIINEDILAEVTEEVAAPQMPLIEDVQPGMVYNVHHSRKGRFQMAVTEVSGEWVKGVITAGRARYISIENNLIGRGHVGDVVTVRFSLCKEFTLVGPFEEVVE